MTNRELFELYIQENLDNAYRFALSYTKHPQVAEDVVIESALKALKYAHSLKDSDKIKTWFFRIIINTANTAFKEKSKVLYLDSHEHEKTVDYDFEGRVSLKELVEQLEPKYRVIIILRYFEDMSLGEIAETLSENINTVKTRLYTALKILRVEMAADNSTNIRGRN